MNRFFISISAILLHISVVNAQIPNGGFEMWSSMGSYENPNGWSTMNDVTSNLSVYTATQGTPGNPGNSYLMLTSQTIGPTVVNGIAVSGTFDPVTQQPTSGFPFSGQPQSLTGKWQHMIYGSSQGSISAILTRWDAASNTRVTVATATKTLSGMAMSWANFTIPFVYTETNAPDTCIIVLKASGTMPTNQDYLWVDNLAFSGNVAGISELKNDDKFSVYPNPTSEIVHVSVDNSNGGTCTVELINEAGQLVLSKETDLSKDQHTFSIEVGDLPKGVYQTKITTGNTVETKMVVIH